MKYRQKHGESHSKEWNIWKGMKSRCNNKNSHKYDSYGGRGIKVCERWMYSIVNFIEDMGRCPNGYSLDRIDNNGNYELDNCRWTTPKVQANNRRNSIRIEYKDELLTVKEISKILKIPASTIYRKLKDGVAFLSN